MFQTPGCAHSCPSPACPEGRVLDSTAGSKDFTAICRPLVAAIEADGQAAICRVADSFKALMHVCWCASLDAELHEQGGN